MNSKKQQAITKRTRRHTLHHPALDQLIGMQVRAIRKSKKITQIHLAKGLNVSYQQVQKYEQGRNRIAASTLLCIAAMLDRPVGDFYILADTFLAEAKRQNPH